MRKLALAVLALFVASTNAVAGVPCFAKAAVMATTAQYGEQALFTVVNGDRPMTFYVNARTGTWSLLEFPASRPFEACRLGSGDKFALTKPGSAGGDPS